MGGTIVRGIHQDNISSGRNIMHLIIFCHPKGHDEMLTRTILIQKVSNQLPFQIVHILRLPCHLQQDQKE